MYIILCPCRKIGSVPGKGGEIIKVLGEETLAKITVTELVPGYMDLHYAAQDALLIVHDRLLWRI